MSDYGGPSGFGGRGEQALDFRPLRGVRGQAAEQLLRLAGGLGPAAAAGVGERQAEARLVEIRVEA